MRHNRLAPGFRRAFTLVELMVVVALIGIMAAMIIPEMRGSFDDALLRSTGRDLVSAFNLASSRAISFDQIYRVRFDTEGARYAVERRIQNGTREDFVPLKDVSGAVGKWDTRIVLQINAPDESSSEPGAGQDGGTAAPPEQTSGAGGEAGAARVDLDNAIAFYPDGTADAAEIQLRDRAGFQLRLQLDPVTARVHILEPQHE
ncbi:MAG: prepilin-type N-terminal cleavage/methylation domain-containing protein [Verrucomicrobiota bacterium]|jgi:prepilin-type N-terminal cleavage/methylation domain-containing protein